MAGSVGSPTVENNSPWRPRVRRLLRGGVYGTFRVARRVLKRSSRAAERSVQIARVMLRHGQRKLARAIAVAGRRSRSVQEAFAYAQTLVFYRPSGELHACPGCGSSKLALLAPLSLNQRPRGHRFGFATGCHTCGLLFANPMPSPAALRHFYSPDGEWARERETEPRKGKGAKTAALLKSSGLASGWLDVTRPPDGGSVLDVGSGGGELLDIFQSYGWRTVGVDPADKRAFPRHAELAAIPCDQSFDVVVLHHVLEHVPRPLELVKQIRAALKPCGVLFISVPRLDTLSRHRDFRYCINARTHIVAFSYDGLRTLLALAGFECVDVNAPIDADTTDWYNLRRLKVLARKVDGVVLPAPRPLDAARAALSRYYAQESEPAWLRRLPARARAAIADRRRSHSVSDS